MLKDYILLKKKNRKIVGRGEGSGSGKTCGRGTKGQNARKGPGPRETFEGGQTGITRFPKVGFYHKKKNGPIEVFNLDRISNISPDKQILDFSSKRIKVLAGKQELTRKITIKCFDFSRRAKEIVEKAGGSLEKIN